MSEYSATEGDVDSLSSGDKTDKQPLNELFYQDNFSTKDWKVPWTGNAQTSADNYLNMATIKDGAITFGPVVDQSIKTPKQLDYITQNAFGSDLKVALATYKPPFDPDSFAGMVFSQMKKPGSGYDLSDPFSLLETASSKSNGMKMSQIMDMAQEKFPDLFDEDTERLFLSIKSEYGDVSLAEIIEEALEKTRKFPPLNPQLDPDYFYSFASAGKSENQTLTGLTLHDGTIGLPGIRPNSVVPYSFLNRGVMPGVGAVPGVSVVPGVELNLSAKGKTDSTIYVMGIDKNDKGKIYESRIGEALKILIPLAIVAAVAYFYFTSPEGKQAVKCLDTKNSNLQECKVKPIDINDHSKRQQKVNDCLAKLPKNDKGLVDTALKLNCEQRYHDKL